MRVQYISEIENKLNKESNKQDETKIEDGKGRGSWGDSQLQKTIFEER